MKGFKEYLKNNVPSGSKESEEPKASLLAKKSFTICQNEYFREIKEGDDLSDIPETYLPNLLAEGVI